MESIVISVLLPGDGGHADCHEDIEGLSRAAAHPASIEFISYALDESVSPEGPVLAGQRDKAGDLEGRHLALRGPDRSFVSRTNECADRATGGIILLWHAGARFRSPGWDNHLRGAILRPRDNMICMAVGDGADRGDTILRLEDATAPLPVTVALSRKWFQAAGQFLCPACDDAVSILWVSDVAFRLRSLVFVSGAEVDPVTIQGHTTDNGRQRVLSGLAKYQQCKAYRTLDARQLVDNVGRPDLMAGAGRQPDLVAPLEQLVRTSHLFDEVRDGRSVPLSFE